MFESQFDESALINVRVPEYFKKLGALMRVDKRKYVLVLYCVLCILKTDTVLHNYFSSESGGEALWWACLYVCLSVCPRSYLRIHTRDLYQTFCACCIWPWLGPPPAGWRNPKRKWKFWGFSSPLTKHCNAFAANNVMQQKGSFHRCQGVMGVHSAGEVWSINLWLPCFDIGNS